MDFQMNKLFGILFTSKLSIILFCNSILSTKDVCAFDANICSISFVIFLIPIFKYKVSYLDQLLKF